MKTVSEDENHLNNVLRLQLKKPKNWNWELTTSRSSPHISLPVVELYNSKGKLLAEARQKEQERRTWHGSVENQLNEDRRAKNNDVSISRFEMSNNILSLLILKLRSNIIILKVSLVTE